MSKPLTFADILFCRQCISCGETLPLFSGEDFCSECRKQVKKLEENTFALPDVQRIRSVYVYDGSPRKALVRFKYNNYAQAGRFMAHEIADIVKKDKVLMSADMVVNVPNGKYTTDRLYNQSMFLAKIVARKCGLKFAPHILKKKSGVKSQLRCRTRLERMENIRSAFSTEKGVDIRGKSVLIIDDITTTGATLNECAKVLIKAGASNVYAATAARAGKPQSPIKIKLLDADIVFTKKPAVHLKFKK